jgi:hypothetical protein
MLKIARLTGDERGDPQTRAVAYAKLESFHKTHPELFALEDVPPWIETPEALAFHDVEPDGARKDVPRSAALARSVKGNHWRKYRGLTVTIFPSKFGAGFVWCVSDSVPKFSRERYATVEDAMFGAWEEFAT